MGKRSKLAKPVGKWEREEAAELAKREKQGAKDLAEREKKAALLEPYDPLTRLTLKQRVFVQHYVYGEATFGNATASAKAAGIGAGAALNNPDVIEAINCAMKSVAKICSAPERMDIRSQIARDPEVPPHVRLQALNDLDKAFGAVEKKQIDIRLSAEVASMSLNDQIRLVQSDLSEIVESDS